MLFATSDKHGCESGLILTGSGSNLSGQTGFGSGSNLSDLVFQAKTPAPTGSEFETLNVR